MIMERYKKQIQLSQVGISGQEELEKAKVLIVGAGGLGCAALPYLVASGVGTVGIIDGDTVEMSNLHRQVLYSENDIGRYKVKAAKAHLQAMNTTVTIQDYAYFLSAENALALFASYDCIVDATDSIALRYLINDACVLTNKPFVYGSIYKFEGQVSVFNYKNGPTYRCLFDKNETKTPNCDALGVLGTTVGFIGMLQANEALKVILNIGDLLSGTLLIYDMLNHRQNKIQFTKNEQLVIDDAFYKAAHLKTRIHETTFDEARTKKTIFLDVREFDTQPVIKLSNSIQIPLSILEQKLHELNKNQHYSIFCQRGKRSLKAIEILRNNMFNHLANVTNGVASFKSHFKDEIHIY